MFCYYESWKTKINCNINIYSILDYFSLKEMEWEISIMQYLDRQLKVTQVQFDQKRNGKAFNFYITTLGLCCKKSMQVENSIANIYLCKCCLWLRFGGTKCTPKYFPNSSFLRY